MRATARTLIFLHVPKTGGTTFRKILERNFDRKEVLTFKDGDYAAELERFAKSPESERLRYRLIQGHLYFGFHRFVPDDSTYMTWVREPIARARSFYSHVRTHPEHYLHRRLIEERLDLKGLLERNATPELFNLQTRMIAGERSNAGLGLERSALEVAKQNLETNFCFVGLTEEFDASLIMLSEMLNWNRPFYMRRNVTSERKGPESLDPETDRLLREANALDLELYQFAKSLFEARRQGAGPAFESKLRHFQRLNSIGAGVQRHYGKMKRIFDVMTFRNRRRELAALKENAAGPSV
ncbi:MAG TPA: sulfotransferase family 2 domain-containing protein [Chthoniobacterales bacterium]|nr:sulfotransferase family 2 domain-containing protein [Chthoniobacterales bacterium]